MVRQFALHFSHYELPVFQLINNSSCFVGVFFLFTNLISNPRKVGFRSMGFPNSKSHFSSLFATNCYRNQPFWRLIFEVMVVCFVGIVWTLLYSDALRGAFVTSKLS